MTGPPSFLLMASHCFGNLAEKLSAVSPSVNVKVAVSTHKGTITSTQKSLSGSEDACLSGGLSAAAED